MSKMYNRQEKKTIDGAHINFFLSKFVFITSNYIFGNLLIKMVEILSHDSNLKVN